MPTAPPVINSPMRPVRNEKTSKANANKKVTRPVEETRDSSSCSSPASASENEGVPSDAENEDPNRVHVPSANKRARADATSTESLSPPRTNDSTINRMVLRSSARKPQQTKPPIPVSTPSFRQQRKHRRVDLDVTPLNTSNNKKLPPKQSSTPHTSK